MNKLRALGAAALMAPALAFAEVPASVTAAITEAGTDVAVVAGGVLGVIVIVFGFVMMRRGLR